MNETPRAKKRFGQHFLTDPAVIGAIARRFGAPPGARVLEIGPGTGAITGALLDTGVNLVAVEIDRDMHARLQERFGDRPGFSLVRGDVLDLDVGAVAAGERLYVTGNLPYNITSPIVFHLLDAIGDIENMYFMMQKEVAERFAAAPGGRDYGRPSVMVQRLCDVEMDIIIPPTAFEPPPRVMSAMLRLRPRAMPLGGAVDTKLFDRVVAAAFAQRRKTLRNALKQLATPERLEQAGIDPSARAETVPVDGYARLARELSAS